MDIDKQDKVGGKDATLMKVPIPLLECQKTKTVVVEVCFRNPITRC